MAAILVYEGPVESPTIGDWVAVEPAETYIIQQSGYNVTGLNFQFSLDGVEAMTPAQLTSPSPVRLISAGGSSATMWRVEGVPINFVRYRNLGGDVGQAAKTYIQSL